VIHGSLIFSRYEVLWQPRGALAICGKDNDRYPDTPSLCFYSECLLCNSQTQLHKMFHTLLLNPSSRKPVLDFVAQVLQYNAKRTQMQSEESTLAGDGFMLNLLSVLQQLALKVKRHPFFFLNLFLRLSFLCLILRTMSSFCLQIKLETVDLYYLFDPSSCLDIKNDTRLKLSSQETSDWLDELSKLFRRCLLSSSILVYWTGTTSFRGKPHVSRA